MSHIQYVDELIREYLLYRGFSGTVKTFDSELKVDKDKSFRPDKVTEFFARVTPELIGQPEWKEWFMLPWVKNPEENPVFQMHFTRHWQDTLLVSLHNFLATIFQCMPQPMLVSFEEDALKMKRLQEENEMLRMRVTTLLENARNNITTVTDLPAPEVPQPAELMDDFYVIALETGSTGGESQVKTLKNLIRNIGSGLPTSPILGRKVSHQTSIGSSKIKAGNTNSIEEIPVQQVKKHSSSGAAMKPRTSWTGSGKIPSVEGTSKAQNSSEPPPRPPRDSSVDNADRKVKQQPIPCQVGSAVFNVGEFLLLSQGTPLPKEDEQTTKECIFIFNMRTCVFVKQILWFEAVSFSSAGERKFKIIVIPEITVLIFYNEEYGEHRAPVCHCRFNASGSNIVSADVDGVLKVWTNTPTPQTVASFVSKSSVMSLDWVSTNERYFISGNKQGLVRLYDVRDNRIMWELGAEQGSPLKETRIMTICCSPVESTFICSVGLPAQAGGKLLLFDIKTKKLERSLALDSTQNFAVATCCTFNHNGQLLVAGCSDGSVRIFDLRRSDCIDSWMAHQGELCQRSLNQSGQALWEAPLQDCPPLMNMATPHGQLFAFHPSGSHVLTCGLAGGNIYEIAGSGLNRMLQLGGHRSPTLAVDWALAHHCATCVTASSGRQQHMPALAASLVNNH
ncbi:WD repeat-containing protein 91 [Blattella germanica]|nr:WD repeat-containing protein 91 [Blattella germanica]